MSQTVPKEVLVHPSFLTPLWLCVCLVLFTASCSNATPTDPALVGTWKTTGVLDGRQWKFTYEILESNRYRFTSKTTDGKLYARNGKWTLKSRRGFEDGGTYEFSGSNAVSITGNLGTGAWTRIDTGDHTSGSRVDKDLLGTWETTVPMEGKQWTLTWKMKETGMYKLTAVTADGTFSAKDGQWKTVSESGQTTEGQYTFLDPNAISMTGPAGTGMWKRTGPAPTQVVQQAKATESIEALVARMHHNAKGAVSHTFTGSTKTVMHIKKIHLKDGTRLIVTEYKEECFTGGRDKTSCMSHSTRTNHAVLQLPAVDPSSIKFVSRKPSGESFTEDPVQFDIKAVQFICQDDVICWDKNGRRGWIPCRNDQACEEMEKDFAALLTLVGKTASTSVSKPVMAKKPRVKQTRLTSCNASVKEKGPHGINVKTIVEALRHVEFTTETLRAGWRPPVDTPKVYSWAAPKKQYFRLCGKGIYRFKADGVTGRVVYLIHNTQADAQDHADAVNKHKYDSQFLGEELKFITVKNYKVKNEGEGLVGWCSVPMTPQFGRPLRVICADTGPVLGVMTFVLGDFLQYDTDPHEAMERLDQLRFTATKYGAQAMLKYVTQ